MGKCGEPTGVASFNRLWPIRGDYTVTLGPKRRPVLLPAPLAHGAVGVWDEVSLIAVGALVVVAYDLWLYAVRNRR